MSGDLNPRASTRLVRTLHALIATAALSLSAIPTAHAFEDDVAKAAKAYRQAQQAELAEEFALAADLYTLAYELAPSGEALRGAMRMALESERWVLAADRASELIEKFPDDLTSQALAIKTLERTRPLIAEVQVSCGEMTCSVLVDGKVATIDPAPEHAVFVEAGKHQITGGYRYGTSAAVEVVAEAGGSARIELVPPPEPVADDENTGTNAGKGGGRGTEAPQRRWQRLPPWAFAIGAVATTGVTVGGIVSGLQAKRAGEDFDTGGKTRALYDDADKLEKQTNVLFAVAGGLAVVTIALGVFTKWNGRSSSKNRARLTSGPGMAGLGLHTRF